MRIKRPGGESVEIRQEENNIHVAVYDVEPLKKVYGDKILDFYNRFNYFVFCQIADSEYDHPSFALGSEGKPYYKSD